jgi:hypothetical protein
VLVLIFFDDISGVCEDCSSDHKLFPESKSMVSVGLPLTIALMLPSQDDMDVPADQLRSIGVHRRIVISATASREKLAVGA